MVRNKAIVTGGAGFIGSHLAEELVNQGYFVIILDDLSTGRMENIAELLRKENVEFIQGSITDLVLLQKLFQGVQYVFHLAALARVLRSIEDPAAANEVNITGTLNVLIAARDNSVKKVVYASSSSIYGDTPTLPKDEQMVPQPQSPYAVSKLAGEYYCQVFHHVYHLNTACLRYFNVYGPGQEPNSEYSAVIPRFIGQVFRKEPLFIDGDGEQTRDFTFVKDAVEANILAVNNNANGVFNIGSGECITINELVRDISEITGGNVKPIYREPRPGDVRHSLADISRARTFGYEPMYDLEAGLKETINWLSNE